MNKLPILFGYAGILPFVLCTFTMLFGGEKGLAMVTLMVAYGGMILSFLGGVHWGQAIPTNNKKQLSFAMIPTVISFVLLFAALAGFYLFALIGSALMFWITYKADIVLMPIEYIPPKYFEFRRNLTYIVIGLHFICILAIMG